MRSRMAAAAAALMLPLAAACDTTPAAEDPEPRPATSATRAAGSGPAQFTKTVQDILDLLANVSYDEQKKYRSLGWDTLTRDIEGLYEQQGLTARWDAKVGQLHIVEGTCRASVQFEVESTSTPAMITDLAC